MRIKMFTSGCQQMQVLIARDADKDPRSSRGELVWSISRRLHCLPNQFQQQPLLWIHPAGFAARQIEEAVVEVLNMLEESAPARPRGLWPISSGIVSRAPIPAFARNFANGIDSSRD